MLSVPRCFQFNHPSNMLAVHNRQIYFHFQNAFSSKMLSFPKCFQFQNAFSSKMLSFPKCFHFQNAFSNWLYFQFNRQIHFQLQNASSSEMLSVPKSYIVRRLRTPFHLLIYYINTKEDDFIYIQTHKRRLVYLRNSVLLIILHIDKDEVIECVALIK